VLLGTAYNVVKIMCTNVAREESLKVHYSSPGKPVDPDFANCLVSCEIRDVLKVIKCVWWDVKPCSINQSD